MNLAYVQSSLDSVDKLDSTMIYIIVVVCVVFLVTVIVVVIVSWYQTKKSPETQFAERSLGQKSNFNDVRDMFAFHVYRRKLVSS